MIDYLMISAFDSIWFWLFLLLQWAVILLRPLGIPYHVVVEPLHGHALSTFVRVQQNTYNTIFPAWVVAVIGFAVAVLVGLASTYKIEIAMAVLFVVVPQIIVLWWAQRVIAQLDASDVAASRKQVQRHQTRCQVLGIVVVCAASFVGSAWHITV